MRHDRLEVQLVALPLACEAAKQCVIVGARLPCLVPGGGQLLDQSRLLEAGRKL